MNIKKYDSGKIGILGNGIGWDIQEFIPKIEIISVDSGYDYFGKEYHYIHIKIGKHRNDTIGFRYHNVTKEIATELSKNEASKTFPLIHSEKLYGIYWNGESYQIYLNGFRVTEEEAIKHTEGLD